VTFAYNKVGLDIYSTAVDNFTDRLLLLWDFFLQITYCCTALQIYVALCYFRTKRRHFSANCMT